MLCNNIICMCNNILYDMLYIIIHTYDVLLYIHIYYRRGVLRLTYRRELLPGEAENQLSTQLGKKTAQLSQDSAES